MLALVRDSFRDRGRALTVWVIEIEHADGLNPLQYADDSGSADVQLVSSCHELADISASTHKRPKLIAVPNPSFS